MVIQSKAVTQQDFPLYTSFFGVISTPPLLLDLKVNRFGEEVKCLEIWQNSHVFSRKRVVILIEAQYVAIDIFPFLLTPVPTWAHFSKHFNTF